MKKVLFFFFALVTSIGAFAQGRCNFSTFNNGELDKGNGYIESSNAEGWHAINCMVAAGWDESYAQAPDYTHSNLYGDNCNTIAALVLTGNVKGKGQLTSPTLTGGCGKLTVNYGLGVMSYQGCSIHVTVKQNGEAVQEFDIEETSFQNNTAYSLEKDINVAGDFTLEFVNNAPSLKAQNSKDRVAIWNIEWTGYGAAAKTVNSLAELDNNKTYSIRCQSGDGYICYAPKYTDTYLYVCGAENYLFDDGGSIKEELKAPFDANNPNHLWQIANDGENYYLYNVGAKKYAKLSASDKYTNSYSFVSEPTAIYVTENTGDLAGTFGFNTTGSATHYLCVSNRYNDEPVLFWTYDDHGAIMVIEEAEYPADDIVSGLQLAETFKNAIAEAKAQYQAGSKYIKSDNLFTDPSQFESQWTDPTEGSVAASCDGDPDTFWHSTYQGGPVAPGTHDFFITLNEPVGGEMELAMTRRNQALNDHILAFDVHASTDKESFAYVGTVNTPFANASETVTGTFEVPEGTQKLRFVIAKTDYGRGYGHFAEFKLFAQKLDPECFNAQNPEAAKALAEAIAAAEEVTAPTQEDIDALQTAVATYLEGDVKAFIASIRYQDSNLYFSTTEVPDNSVTTYSLAAEPEYFIFTETEDGGYILQSESTGKYVGHGKISDWDFSDYASVWYIDNLDGELTTIRKDDGAGFGTDYANAGAGVYTDKGPGNGGNPWQYWYVEQKVEKPAVDPNTFMYVTADPANNAKVTELNTIKLTFDDDVFIMPFAQSNLGASMVNVATNEEVTIAALDYDEEAFNVVNIILAEPITELGTYSITIPEMCVWNSKIDLDNEDDFGISNGALYNPEFTLTYTVALDPRPKAGKVYTIRSEAFGIASDYYVGTSTTPSTTPVEFTCSVTESGKYIFTAANGEQLRFKGVGDVEWEITPMTELTAADMNQSSLPENYIVPEAVVMRAYHSDGRYLYLNINLNTGNYDHGENLFAPWNSSYTSFFVFEEVPEPTEWNGKINVPTSAATVDELLDYNVEFEGASNLDVSDYGLLAAVFDNSGDVYAVAFVGKDYEQFGSVDIFKSTFTIHFEKVADLTAELKDAVIKKIGGFVEPTEGVATVYVCPKSFVFDGKTYTESLNYTYEVAGNGTATGIESINVENNNVELFDLQGRRVIAPVKGNLYIQNGKKVMK